MQPVIHANKIIQIVQGLFEGERTAGLILILCTIVSLVLTNFFGHSYSDFWHVAIFSRPLEFWINDGLMTIFFLLVGLEIEREIYRGELFDVKRAMLPILGATGGMLIPAFIHFAFNHGTSCHGNSKTDGELILNKIKRYNIINH